MAKGFLQLFSEYKPCENTGLEQLMVKSASVNREEREASLLLTSPEYVRFECISTAISEIEKIYSLSKLKVGITYENLQFSIDYVEDILCAIEAENPTCKGFFNNSKHIIEGDLLTISLAHGGLSILEKNCIDKKLETYIKDTFQTRIRLEFSGVTEVESSNALYKAATEEHDLSIISTSLSVKSTSKTENKSAEVIHGKIITAEPISIKELSIESGNETIIGEIFGLETRKSKDGKITIVTFNITDLTSSFLVKLFPKTDKAATLLAELKDGLYVKIRGSVKTDDYSHEPCMMCNDINRAQKVLRMDNLEHKRVELHLHTSMSQMDGITDVADYIKTAKRFGHPAIAITDHGVLQAYPNAFGAAKKCGYEGKLIYGIENYFVNDFVPGVKGNTQYNLDDEFIVFDVETTGLSAKEERITEIGAALICKGEILDTFSSFVNPEKPIPPKITEITGITDKMVYGAPRETEAMTMFLDFCKKRPVVAHNAPFDMSFISAACGRAGFKAPETVIDTLVIARSALKELKKYSLNVVAAHFNIPLEHHRAENDAVATAKIFIKFLENAKEEGAKTLAEFEKVFSGNIDVRKGRVHHQIILVKNQIGLKNLFKLVTKSNLNYFGNKRSRIPKSELVKHREGLIIGSACEAGELFSAVVEGRPFDDLIKIGEFYDYLEIQPLCNNMFLIEKAKAKDKEALIEFNRQIIKLGERLKKPVIATGDVHFLNPEDEIFRKIILAGQGFSDADKSMPLYYRTTEEMLEEFSYLGEEKAFEVVVTNPNKIAEMCETVIPLKKTMYPPVIEGSEIELREICNATAKEIYGENLPDEVAQRIERELDPIIGNGYAVMYMTARKLVQKSISDGYLVGSRGSVGSSFAAFLAGITEVNALAPHYICKNEACRHVKFDSSGKYEVGCDMEDASCEKCGSETEKAGFDIPFETFLGFEGEKIPDIDLNFSGDYQSVAHQYTEELFGKGYVFRAGTIGTIASKTAYGYVKKYLDERGIYAGKAELDRLSRGCTGIKRTTGQHPGGIMVVPGDMEIEDFTAVQFPADAAEKNIITTHFDYHAIHDNILKLDILGHDDPTVLRMLEDLTGVNVMKIPLDDKRVRSLFNSEEALDLKKNQDKYKSGAIAIPEFGTKFVRGMLKDTAPATFGELVRISGLSHGTDVWLGNAEKLIKTNTATLKEAICTRDDIMLYLIQKGVPKSDSFNIMEQVRKGKGISSEQEILMKNNGVPVWYIESCKKIKYMFPKAHAVAYVMMAVRIAWFKVYYPLEFYAAFFSIRADDFDGENMIFGYERLCSYLSALEQIASPTDKEENKMSISEVCKEFYDRGFEFLGVDLYKSDATRFQVENGALRPPLNSLPGVGTNAAASLAEARDEGDFISVEELATKAKVSRTVIETLGKNNVLGDLPESSQMSLF